MVALNEPLTERQTEVLDAVVDALKKHGRPPTLRELGQTLGLSSPTGVLCHLRAIEKKGRIKLGGGSRGMKLVGFEFCPCCGSFSKED